MWKDGKKNEKWQETIGGISGAAASDGKYAFEQHKSPRRGLDGIRGMDVYSGWSTRHWGRGMCRAQKVYRRGYRYNHSCGDWGEEGYKHQSVFFYWLQCGTCDNSGQCEIYRKNDIWLLHQFNKPGNRKRSNNHWEWRVWLIPRMQQFGECYGWRK